MSSCCSICYRESLEDVGVGAPKKFFRLFRRYLGRAAEEESRTQTWSINHLNGFGMVTCEQCLPLMESFCELYHQLKTIELLLNWKVETLKNVMRCAVRASSRTTNLQNSMITVEAPEKFEDVIKSRKLLIKKCSQKLTKDFPKLEIKKWRPDKEAMINGLLQTVERKSSETDGANTISSEEFSSSSPVDLMSSLVEYWKCDSDPSLNNENNDNDPNGTLAPDGNQAKTQRNDGNQASIRDDVTRITSDALLHPISNQVLVSPSLKSEPLPIKMESVEQTKTYIERDVEPVSLEVIQIQLENQPSIPIDVVTGDTKVQSSQSQPSKILRLRASYRCQDCGRTFSSEERLQLHKTDIHIDDNDMGDQGQQSMLLSEDNDEDNEDLSNGGNYSTSSSDEEEDTLDSETEGHHSEDNEMGSKIKAKRRQKLHVPAHQERGGTGNPKSHISFKCPGCFILMADIKALLLHRKTSKPCKDSYDPTASMKVQVLALPKDTKTGAIIKDSNSFDVFAVVDLPQEIYSCESCDMAMYSLEDMEAHMKLHGVFQCNFCDVKTSYAPDLALHEKQEHVSKKSVDGKQTIQSYNCGRCDFYCFSHPNVYIRHHLKEHLSLTFQDPKCAICKTNSDFVTVPRLGRSRSRRLWFRIGTHLKTHHDLSNVTNVDDLKRCKEENCRAYFLTTEQLTEHLKLRHGLQPLQYKVFKQPTIQPHYRLKCPDCNGLFPSTAELLTHRKTSDSCSGLYDPSKSVKVQVLVPPEPRKRGQDGYADDTLFTTVHVIIDLPQAIFVCDIENCEAVQYSSEDMDSHKKLHGAFPCNFCEATATCFSALELPMHELTHLKNGRSCNSHTGFVCPRCDFKCREDTAYIRHHLTSHLSLTLNQPICPICKTNAVNISSRRVEHVYHFKNMHDLTNVTIPEDIRRCAFPNCDAYFLSSKQLAEHRYLRHGGIKEHRRTSNIGKLKSDKIKKQQSKVSKPHKCKDCGKSFRYPTKLRSHRVAKHVEQDKLIRCTVPKCDKIFESKMQLKDHMAHGSTYHKSLDHPTKEKLYVQCPQCNKSISGKHPQFLAYHMTTHARSHFCQLCGKVFKDKAPLDVHLLWHSGPDSWTHECSVCSKKCIDKYKLAEHMRIHSQDKPFVCEICGAKYAHGHNLRIHVKNKHGDEMEDKPKKSNKANLTTKKGTKRKRKSGVESETEQSERDSYTD